MSRLDQLATVISQSNRALVTQVTLANTRPHQNDVIDDYEENIVFVQQLYISMYLSVILLLIKVYYVTENNVHILLWFVGVFSAQNVSHGVMYGNY